jgi:dUTP pyrophosphatase
VTLTRLDHDAVIPSYARPGDAGADLVATSDLLLLPGQRGLIGTGVAIELPIGFAGFVHPRSGMATRAGLGMVNAPGTIDAGYRGEIKVILINHDRTEPIQIRRGDRIAQLVIQRVEYAHFVEVEQLSSSARGADGFGSSGGSGAQRGADLKLGDER